MKTFYFNYKKLSKETISIKNVIIQTYKNLGGTGFFKGILPILSQTALNSAILLMLYEKIFRIFQLLTVLVLKRKTLYQVKNIIF